MHETGKVKIFDTLKGFGFITPKKGREVFFHISGCALGVSRVTAGDLVRFRIIGEGKKRRAVDVTTDYQTNH